MFSSRTNDPKKNPLTPRQKFKWLKRFFSDANFQNVDTIKTPVDMLYWLAERGYRHVYLIGGQDRVEEYKKFEVFMSKSGKDHLNLNSFNVVSAGARDPDAQGVTGMSASKMRAAVAAKDFKTFVKGMPRSANGADVRDLFMEMRKAMGIK